MHKNDDDLPKPARNVLPDLIIPVLALLFSIYYLTTITEVPWISQASAVTVSGLLLLTILAYALRTLYRVRRGEECLRLPRPGATAGTQIKRIILLLLAIAYVYFIGVLGFTLTTFVFVATTVVLLSSPGNWKNALKVAGACAVTGYIVFIYLFQTRFPKGAIETYLDRVL